jgi:hypothetical protein
MSFARWRLLVVVGIAAVALVGSAVCAKEEGNGESKAKVELPEAAAGAVKAAFPNATIKKVGIEDEDGVKLFEVELMQDKAEMEVSVAPDGLIVSVESKVDLKDVPEAAAKAISKAAEGAEIKKVEKEEVRAEVKKDAKGAATLVKLDKPKLLFEAKLIKGDQKGEIEVDADGKIVEELTWKTKGKDEGEVDEGEAKK